MDGEGGGKINGPLYRRYRLPDGGIPSMGRWHLSHSSGARAHSLFHLITGRPVRSLSMPCTAAKATSALQQQCVHRTPWAKRRLVGDRLGNHANCQRYGKIYGGVQCTVARLEAPPLSATRMGATLRLQRWDLSACRHCRMPLRRFAKDNIRARVDRDRRRSLTFCAREKI